MTRTQNVAFSHTQIVRPLSPLRFRFEHLPLDSVIISDSSPLIKAEIVSVDAMSREIQFHINFGLLHTVGVAYNGVVRPSAMEIGRVHVNEVQVGDVATRSICHTPGLAL